MVMRSYFKVAFRIFIILMYACLSVSKATDSATVGPFAGSFTPTTIRAQPYILQQGFLDFTGTPSQNAFWPEGKGGLCWHVLTNAAGFSSCQAHLQLTQDCPLADTPYVTVYSLKSQLSQNGQTSGVCVVSVARLGVGVGLDVWVSGALVYGTSSPYNYGSGFGALDVPMIGFTTYCYPPGTTSPGYENTNCSPVTAAYNNGSPILWESGFVDWPGGSETHTITTTRQCPGGFRPYATIVSTKTWNNGANDFITGGGVCVQSVGPTGSSYLITYLTNDTFTIQSVGSFSATTNGSDVYTLRQFGNVNNSLCPYGVSGGQCIINPFVTGVTNFPINGPADIAGLQWTLYCYPPGITVPAYSGNCTAGSNPF